MICTSIWESPMYEPNIKEKNFLIKVVYWKSSITRYHVELPISKVEGEKFDYEYIMITTKFVNQLTLQRIIFINRINWKIISTKITFLRINKKKLIKTSFSYFWPLKIKIKCLRGFLWRCSETQYVKDCFFSSHWYLSFFFTISDERDNNINKKCVFKFGF